MSEIGTFVFSFEDDGITLELRQLRSAEDVRSNEFSFCLAYFDGFHDADYDGRLTSQKVHAAVARQAGLSGYREICRDETSQSVTFCCADTVDKMQVGQFLLFMVAYTLAENRQ